LRRTDFHHGNDYTNEYFDRRDLTRPASSLDRRLLATRIDDDYTEYYIGRYVDLGLAVLVDVDWGNLNLMAGTRYDRMTSEVVNRWTSYCCQARTTSVRTRRASKSRRTTRPVACPVR